MKKPTEKTPYLFVYGTLMRGMGNNSILSTSLFIDRATTEDNYKLVASSIPFLLEEEGSTYVVGELYKVSEEELKDVDYLEGHPTFYERKVINVITETGDVIEAWAYFYAINENRTTQEIKSGDYRDYVLKRVN